MIRQFRLIAGAILCLAAVPTFSAPTTVNGRGPDNTGAYPDTPFPNAPALVWKSFQGDTYAGKSPSNTVISGKIAITAIGDKLVGISTETGEMLWKQDLKDKPVGDLLLLDDQVIVTLANEGAFAFSPTDGTQIWHRSLFSTVVNGPSYSDDQMVFSTKGNTIQVLARKTGKEIASVDMKSNIEASPLMINKSVIFCFKQGNTIRLEGNANRWAVKIPNTISQNLIHGGEAVVATGPDAIYSLNITSTSNPIRWTFACTDMVQDPPCVDANTVYVATKSSHMYAMDALTGKQQWGDSGIDLLAPAIASPLVVGNNVVVRMKFGLLAAYAKDTGKLSWTYRLPADSPADVTVGAPAIDGDDMYFTASDGSMYHLTAPMADIDPPTFAKILPTMAGDELSNTSTLQYVGAIVEDEGSGVKQDSVTLQLDGNDLTSKLQYNPDSGYFYAQLTPPLQVQLGLHKLIMTATDNRGNQAKLVKEFYVGNAASIERVPIAINGEYVPKQLTVRPGTIIEWVNTSGSSRTVIEDKNQFSSDAAYANGIPAGENWVWVVPGNARPGTKYFYHCRIAGEAGDGQTIGGGLAGVIEVVDARRDMPGLPKYKANALPAFPVPDFANKK